MKAQLFTKIVKASINELPKSIKGTSKSTVFDFVKGVGKKGEFEIYSFFDDAGKLLKRKATYKKDGNITEEITWIKDLENSYLDSAADKFLQKTKVIAINGETKKSIKETWVSQNIRIIEDIESGRGYDIHKFQSYFPKKEAKEISYKTAWDGEVPKYIKCNFANIENTEGFEYLPVLVSPNSSSRYNHLEKINLKYQDLEDVVPKMQVLSRKQFYSKYPEARDMEKAHGENSLIWGQAHPYDGLVEVLAGAKNPFELVDTVAHEYQHVRDFSDVLRLRNGCEDMIRQNIKEKKCGIFTIKLSDFQFNSLKKKGAIPRGSEEYNDLINLKWLIEREDYTEMCLSGQHDDALSELAPIARGNAEKNKFKDLVREVFEVLKCV